MTLRSTALFFVGLLLSGCFDSTTTKPEAIGASGRVNIVIPPGLKSGETGKLLDSLFRQEAFVYPRDEQLFNISFVDPMAVNRSQKSMRNLVFVFTFDDTSPEAAKVKSLITPASLDMLRNDTKGFVVTRPDVFARGQEIMYLFGPDAATLAANIRANGSRLTAFFNEKEKQRLQNRILKSSANRSLAESLGKKYNITIKVPFGYQLADQQEDFFWLRQINPADDKDVWIARRPYRGTDDFKQENLIRFRNSVCQKYLFEDPDKRDTYLVTETSVSYKPIVTREVNFNGLYAVEMRGLWKTNIPSMGGPFMGYALVDEASGYLYYIEGFTFCPSRPQREIMRELEVILQTFMPSTTPAAPK